jgi:hypothetical protein
MNHNIGWYTKWQGRGRISLHRAASKRKKESLREVHTCISWHFAKIKIKESSAYPTASRHSGGRGPLHFTNAIKGILVKIL